MGLSRVGSMVLLESAEERGKKPSGDSVGENV